ncbi:acylphosphatase [Nocardioides sp. InS609-2]|uniref:acylphosphatase n=1 Tax=Nocardioides sp. InS609-2 TaxID=2760705 RepID=UPI0020BFF1BE|nr:acylphosphatase [Nocardioides sp. InS609-2]
MIRRRVVVRGRVQGVFFRASCAQEAAGHQVAGWVSNEPDGSVAAAFEGEPDDVEALVAWCQIGPPAAVVESVDVADEEPRGAQRFDVR